MSNSKALIEYEAGQNAYPLEIMTTSDRAVFSASFKPFSGRAGYEPKIMPNGLVNGGKITPSASANTVIVETALVQMAAVSGADANGQVTITGADVVCARASTDTQIVHSITVNASGALVVVSGVEGTSFSETRGAAGGPALIPVDSIEIGQVRYSSATSGVVSVNDIQQVPGLHVELADFPVYTVSELSGQVKFASELPAIHTGSTSKRVYVSGFTPVFAEVPHGSNWVPAEITHSVNSTQVYGGTVGSSSSSLGQASFSAILKDGITDSILNVVNDRIWIKFKQDRNRIPYQLTHGLLGLARSYPADGNVEASFTLSATNATENVRS
jgi:hypothetical protein